MEEIGKETLITVGPIDILIVTLGSMPPGIQIGSNREPAATLSPDELKHGEWCLKEKLEQQSPKIKIPSNFSSRVGEVET
jgi:myosin-crossreactive antigen